MAQDAASALLAAQVGADMLLLLTDAPAVYDPAKWPQEKAPVRSPIKAAELLGSGAFARGSMGPKVRGHERLIRLHAAFGGELLYRACMVMLVQVQSACRFVEETGKPAGIGALGDALAIARGEKGTLIVP